MQRESKPETEVDVKPWAKPQVTTVGRLAELVRGGGVVKISGADDGDPQAVGKSGGGMG